MRKSNPLGSACLAGVSMRQEVEFLTHEKQKFDGHKQHAKGHENIDGPFRDSEGLVDHAAALIRRDGGDGAVIADDGTDDGAQQAYKRIDHTSYAFGQICCDNVDADMGLFAKDPGCSEDGGDIHRVFEGFDYPGQAAAEEITCYDVGTDEKSHQAEDRSPDDGKACDESIVGPHNHIV